VVYQALEFVVRRGKKGVAWEDQIASANLQFDALEALYGPCGGGQGELWR